MSSPYRDEIVAACTKHRVDPFLVEAMVTVESSHHADAFRHEAGFWRRYLVDNPTYMHQVPRRRVQQLWADADHVSGGV